MCGYRGKFFTIIAQVFPELWAAKLHIKHTSCLGRGLFGDVYHRRNQRGETDSDGSLDSSTSSDEDDPSRLTDLSWYVL